MNKYEGAELCLKILSIYFLLQFFQTLPLSFEMLVDIGKYDSKLALTGSISASFITLCISVFLWKLSPKISKIIWGDKTTEADVVNPTLNEVQAALFSAIGLYVLISTIPNLFYCLVVMSKETPEFQHQSLLDMKSKINLSVNIFKIIIGVWLIFGSKGLVNLILKVRNLGLDKQSK